MFDKKLCLHIHEIKRSKSILLKVHKKLKIENVEPIYDILGREIENIETYLDYLFATASDQRRRHDIVLVFFQRYKWMDSMEDFKELSVQYSGWVRTSSGVRYHPKATVAFEKIR